ncbi:MAG: hypothetical protein GY723_20180 [bacterium]|nr:hypothetical protein [bacterium]MCP5065205.1 hypothetical protein [bacterium]
MKGLRALRDELRVQSELGSMEARDHWRQLEHRWGELEGKLKLVREEAQEDAGEIGEAVKILGEELRAGFERLRSRL